MKNNQIHKNQHAHAKVTPAKAYSCLQVCVYLNPACQPAGRPASHLTTSKCLLIDIRRAAALAGSLLGGDDKIKILELDFLHLHEGVGHKMIKFGENQSSLA